MKPSETRRTSFSVAKQLSLFADSTDRRGTGSGAGPYIAIHEGFQGVQILLYYAGTTN